MGMYTEVLVKAEVNLQDTAKVNIDALQYLFGESSKPEVLPRHKFFTLPRWGAIGHGCSFYHVPFPTSRADIKYGTLHIFSRSDFKSYDGEAEAFFDWLLTFAKSSTGKCIGWIWYEEWDTPKLVLELETNINTLG